MTCTLLFKKTQKIKTYNKKGVIMTCTLLKKNQKSKHTIRKESPNEINYTLHNHRKMQFVVAFLELIRRVCCDVY